MIRQTLMVLGSGTSHGVPLPGCRCDTCCSTDPRDCRTRASVWLRTARTSILIDCGPDLRQQLLTRKISRFDGVLLTHTHADHLNGLDDLQTISEFNRCEIPFYATQNALKDIRFRFDYIDKLKFHPDGKRTWGVPQLGWHCVVPGRKFMIGDQPVIPVPLLHGRARTVGYRLGDIAYLSDCSCLPEEAYPLLHHLDILVIDGLRWKPHPTHFCIPQVLEEIRKIRPRRTYITHLTHDILHARDSRRLPENVYFTYDGLVLESSYREERR